MMTSLFRDRPMVMNENGLASLLLTSGTTFWSAGLSSMESDTATVWNSACCSSPCSRYRNGMGYFARKSGSGSGHSTCTMGFYHAHATGRDEQAPDERGDVGDLSEARN